LHRQAYTKRGPSGSLAGPLRRDSWRSYFHRRVLVVKCDKKTTGSVPCARPDFFGSPAGFHHLALDFMSCNNSLPAGSRRRLRAFVGSHRLCGSPRLPRADVQCVVLRCVAVTKPGPASADKTVTWLILPVVICLSQRLSHACLSINNFIL
jgi:hypothetical protein